MASHKNKLVIDKSGTQEIVEYILLLLCMVVIAMRVTFTESPGSQSSSLLLVVGDNIFNLAVSALLVCGFIFWAVWNAWSGKSVYRFSGIEPGLALFCIASLVSGLAAANKRAAVTDFVSIAAPVLMALLLVQILDTDKRIRLVLIVIIALAGLTAHQCFYQLLVENKLWIEFYRENPDQILEQMGIRPGSFQQMLFEHRLYSEDVRGFFTTSNSAGSFLLMAAFAAISLFTVRLKRWYLDRKSPRKFPYLTLFVVIVVLVGLLAARSKGAIAAFLIAAVMYAVYLAFPRWLNAHKKLILVSAFILIIAVVSLIVSYGHKHGRLPGGNSMLVRWQYWNAAAQMYADHPLTGVGPGNFAKYYTHYKPDAALESVGDPHNFVLTLLTQYGPLGLFAFLAMILIPAAFIIFPRNPLPMDYRIGADGEMKKIAILFLVVISAALLFIRPIITPMGSGSTVDVGIAVFISYIIPVLAFIVVFWLLVSDDNSVSLATVPSVKAAFFCAVTAVLIHNLIDYAIFEPAVLTTFWAVFAALVAIDSNKQHRQISRLYPSRFVKSIVTAGGLICAFLLLFYAVIPVAETTLKTKQAMEAPGFAHQLLDSAAEDDPLDPSPLDLNARMYIQHYKSTGGTQTELLKKAEICLLDAVRLNNADYQNYELLAEVYIDLADGSKNPALTAQYYQKALDAAADAVKCYPGSAELRIKFAETAEKLNMTETAIEQYRKAVQIEDAYRQQFKKMYPGREIFSRLGENQYQMAKQKIEALSLRKFSP